MLDSFSYQHEPNLPPKLHDWNIIPKTKNKTCNYVPPVRILNSRKNVYGPGPITWTVGDIAKAGCLLSVPQISVSFDDEQEMRRVYTLIYDVFRYKNILTQALNDVGFFETYFKLKETLPSVWLLFYDLYHRSFKKRETAVIDLVNKLFRNAKLSHVENALWSQRVKLAAAVARLRIKNNALSLTDLLPNHLKGTRVSKTGNCNPVTVWINNKMFKNAHDICKQIENCLKVKLAENSKDLGPNDFKWDQHCPLTVAFHYSMRGELARSTLVRNHKLVVQDRSFCLGPATFWKIVDDLKLCGSVIQTHVNSPRSTAYLATLLSQNEKINKLIAFNAGKRKNEYENYFNKLGMTNVVILSDRLVDIPPESPYMEEIVAVYATPPNSYSAVNDPIDLVCSRGGDLSMLEVLTETEVTVDGKSRVSSILDEQKKTLKFAMSKPQIQFVLYETHSELNVENSDMIQKTMKEINTLAKMHHAVLQGAISSFTTRQDTQTLFEENNEINNNKDLNYKQGEYEMLEKSEEKYLDHVLVPDTDIFHTLELPCLCPNEVPCPNASNNGGCYLALLQRKQVIRLDNKYMIEMAEQRGLFGDKNVATGKAKGQKGYRSKIDKSEIKPKKPRRKLQDTEDLYGQLLNPDILKLQNKFLNVGKADSLMMSEDEESVGVSTASSLDSTSQETGSKTIIYVDKATSPCFREDLLIDPKLKFAMEKTGGFLNFLSKGQIKDLVSSSFKVGCGPIYTVLDKSSTKKNILVDSKSVQKFVNEILKSTDCDISKKDKINKFLATYLQDKTIKIRKITKLNSSTKKNLAIFQKCLKNNKNSLLNKNESSLQSRNKIIAHKLKNEYTTFGSKPNLEDNKIYYKIPWFVHGTNQISVKHYTSPTKIKDSIKKKNNCFKTKSEKVNKIVTKPTTQHCSLLEHKKSRKKQKTDLSSIKSVEKNPNFFGIQNAYLKNINKKIKKMFLTEPDSTLLSRERKLFNLLRLIEGKSRSAIQSFEETFNVAAHNFNERIDWRESNQKLKKKITKRMVEKIAHHTKASKRRISYEHFSSSKLNHAINSSLKQPTDSEKCNTSHEKTVGKKPDTVM